MGSKQAAFGAFAVICMVTSAIFVLGVGHAQDPKLTTAREMLKSKAEKLGVPKIEVSNTVSGKQ